MRLDPTAVKELVRRALEEDIGSGDITTAALVPPGGEGSAEIVAGDEDAARAAGEAPVERY